MSEEVSNRGEDFPQTSVTLYQRVVSESPGTSKVALEEFFRQYWYPLYGLARARGSSHADASDLVQDFIVHELLERDQIRQWNPQKGRLRTFLQVALDRFGKNQHRRDSARKRGGPKAETHLSLDFAWAQGRYEGGAVDRESPDRLFEREWAEVTVQQAMGRLANDYAVKGKSEEFQLLCRNLSGRAGDGEGVRYEEIAEKLGTTANNVKQKMTVFRERFRRALKAEVAQTVDASEVEDECRFLSNYLMGRLQD